MDKKKTILLVDDTPDNLSFLSKVLQDDFKVKVANDGTKALKAATSGVPPDLILLDIMMPELDGYEVCRRLKADASTANIPIIFVTGKDSRMDEAKGLMLGAVDFVMKPIDVTLVKTRIRVHLAQVDRMSKIINAFREQISELKSENARLRSELALKC
ncbi:MAG: response regulator [Magnetococcales bacterium]|nr:response regulator [Magnetococcales bacterium]